MKTIDCWNGLAKYGIVPLTGEACGLMYRMLCDVTANGKKIVEKCLGVRIEFAEPWNRGDTADPHVGSIMLAPQLLIPLSVFALLESGCTECRLYANGSLLGVEPSDPPEVIERRRAICPESLARTFRYGGTAGDRNLHVMSGRVV